ncbi:MAG: hypothetical protein K8L97_21840 [Anaerolineae bacterium]|nr:hypothetical protein [Anaerolineae bacterium]
MEYELRVCDPGLWWPWDHGDPHLYRLTVSLLDQADRHLADIIANMAYLDFT